MGSITITKENKLSLVIEVFIVYLCYYYYYKIIIFWKIKRNNS